ncbi:MAG: hypothetical protein FWC36_01760 [Spirochaetes bacterium]|nr:hypothetical protein [Spirochaetota bacterium]
MYEIIEKIIKVLVIKRDNPVINFTFFTDQLATYFESNREQFTGVKNAEEFKNAAIPILKRMETEEACTITYEGASILSFQVHKYYRQLVMKHYKIIEERPEYSFPDTRAFNFKINDSWLVYLNAQQNFIDAPELTNNEKGKILVITFGDGVNSIVIPPEIVNTVLFDVVLKKIHLYVQNQNNFVYIGRYLRKAFEESESAVETMMSSMLNGPPNFKDHIRKPADFSFKFFAYLCNKVIKDLGAKKEKSISDITIYQAMALLRAFITYGRSVQQKESQRISDFKSLASQVKKAPYIYSTAEIFEMKDTIGTPYSKKYSPEFVSDFINKATTRKDDEDLPSVVKISAEPKKDYYIDREMLPQVFLKILVDSGKEIKKQYSKEWGQILRKFKTNKEMQDEKVFLESINTVIKNDYKLLNALLNPSLIYLANRLFDKNKNIKTSVDACFSEPGKFKSINKLLNMDREELLKETMASLPMRYSIPFFGRFIDFFMLLLGRKNKEEDEVAESQKTGGAVEEVFQELGSSSARDETSRQTSPEKAAAPQDLLGSISRLREIYLSGKEMNHALEELIEKWNYMVDKKARKNLTEDINSLIRGFLRSRKRVIIRYKTLNEGRITTLRDDIMKQVSNANIKNKDAFRAYIDLYVIKLLGNLKGL